MRHVCVVGLQWGDEGKGKIVDVLALGFDVVVRYQGGANAGHTIYVGDEKRVLHHLPSGILRDGIRAVLGNGMVVEPAALLEEVSALPDSALDRLYLSDRVHLVLPHHTARDRVRESNAGKIGTTLRGIGPAYEDKFARRGVRLGDLLVEGFLEQSLPELLTAQGHGNANSASALALCRRLVDRLGHRICDCHQVLADMNRQGLRFLFEGAQGSLLDVDFGTYPYVTSSSPSFLGLGSGSGFSPRRIDHVMGVTKAYCTRVGEGPFPTELRGQEADSLRVAGGEFGATTGRPRRCGWLDLPALKYAISINDVDSLAVTKVDVLRGRATVPVAVGYRLNGCPLERFPAQAKQL
ncbi:MAG: adenylosuccinate synthase, partial [Planctomycetota bacterium]